MADIEQDLLNTITAYIDAQRGGGPLTPDIITLVVNANSMRAVLELNRIEKGKKK